MARQDTIDDRKAEARRWRNKAIRREIEDRMAEPDAPWRDLETLKDHVEGHLDRAKKRTELTPEQRRVAEENIGFGVWMARSRWRRAKRADIDFAEVVAAARLGVEDAAARFDPTRGTPFAAFARGFVMRRISELHRDHDLKPDADPDRPWSAPRNRWDHDRFEWPEYDDVRRELRRMAESPDPPFTVEDLVVLEHRAGAGKSQAETAALMGISRSAVGRIEQRAAERVRPHAESLREDSTDRYLLSVLSPDEILRVYGRDTPIPEQRAWLEENGSLQAAIAKAMGRQAARHAYGRNAITDGTDDVFLG